MWFDNHCHLTTLRIPPTEVVEEAAAAGVDRLLTVGCTVDDSRAAIDIAAGFDRVWATAGVHPHDAKDGLDGLADEIDRSIAIGAPVVAVGECGLDYHYDHSPRDVQRAVFAEQVALANERDMALVIHSREAWADTFAVLDDVGPPARMVFHCFTGGPVEAEACLERGAMISYSGIVTFRSADDVREAARLTPIDRVLVETDSPYLAPEPHRGKPNRPALVAVVGAKIAELHDRDPGEVAEATVANGIRLYQL